MQRLKNMHCNPVKSGICNLQEESNINRLCSIKQELIIGGFPFLTVIESQIGGGWKKKPYGVNVTQTCICVSFSKCRRQMPLLKLSGYGRFRVSVVAGEHGLNSMPLPAHLPSATNAKHGIGLTTVKSVTVEPV